MLFRWSHCIDSNVNLEINWETWARVQILKSLMPKVTALGKSGSWGHHIYSANKREAENQERINPRKQTEKWGRNKNKPWVWWQGIGEDSDRTVFLSSQRSRVTLTEWDLQRSGARLPEWGPQHWPIRWWLCFSLSTEFSQCGRQTCLSVLMGFPHLLNGFTTVQVLFRQLCWWNFMGLTFLVFLGDTISQQTPYFSGS